MMQKCHRKKGLFPLMALVLFVFIIFSILYKEITTIQRIRQSQPQNEGNDDQPQSSDFQLQQEFLPRPTVLLNRSLSSRAPPVRLWSTVAEEFCHRSRVAGGGNRKDQLACHKHGRPDVDYQYWRWQPLNCNLKRWNVTEMWEKLRGKRLMFVGDSLTRGQWISMVCLLQSIIPADKKSMTPQAQLTTFTAQDYNATVEFLWAPLLVESNSDDPVDHRLPERILRPDSILRHASQWKDADILVFNSYLWWRQGPVKLLWSNEDSGVCEEIDGLGGMELAMEAWADWMASDFDALNKQAFFVTMSPTHFLKEEWEPGSEGNCYNERQPISSERYLGNGIHLPTMQIAEKVLRRLSSKVSVLNITRLSDYRKDGHPTIYRKFWEMLSPETLSKPASYSDCIHWCLPGVPDVWNELLFQYL
ncbi:protein trichome birefringence-like 35 isoform X2 [Coffea arabica]|uniref:Protein trichome birefringence-like 35 isoform X2 n=1 Tax=Coffea arabica TaxID=13443 RepID=A0A6P6SS92_COFAR|nr:protein trichome birefringence-like 35 isoform X2 [Coffea arabica]